eukprot:gene24615-29741_t
MESQSCAVTISFESFRFDHVLEEGAPAKPFPSKMWLSWTIFKETFQATLPPNSSNDPIVQDTFDIDYIYRGEGLNTFIPAEILHNFPLKVFLCCEDYIMAMALFDPFSSIMKSKGAAGLHLPVDHTDTVRFIPVEEEEGFFQASMRATLSLSLPETPPPPPPPSLPPSPKRVTLPPEAPAPVPAQQQQQLQPPSSSALRHYKVSIELRSVKNLVRPSPLYFSFTYPHLGSPGPFRTKPQALRAGPEVENRLAQGVSYQFASRTEQLQATLRAFPLVIGAYLKSPLSGGSGEFLGDVV